MISHPGDRLCDSLRKSIFLLPVCQFFDLCIRTEQTVYFTLLRTQPLLIADDLRFRIDLGDDLLCQFSDRDLLLCRNVDLLSDRLIRFRDRNKSRRSVFYIIKIPGRCQ